MKGSKTKSKAHEVPLAPAAMAIHEKLKPADNASGLIFARQGQRLSRNVFVNLLRAMKVKATAHGFRASFSTWVADGEIASPEVREAALAHVVGSAVARAYNRSNHSDPRRVLMQKWADYLDGREPAASVREFKRA
jgi:integrase